MAPQRKPKADRQVPPDDDIVADSSGKVSEEDIRRLEEIVRPELEKGNWQVDDGPGW